MAKISHLTAVIHLSRFFRLLNHLQITEKVANFASPKGVQQLKASPDSDQGPLVTGKWGILGLCLFNACL